MKKLCWIFFILPFALKATGPTEPLDSAQWSYIESILLYDADTRYNILQLSTETAPLTSMKKLQEKTQKKFQGIIKPLERPEQELIYKLLSQEGLMKDLLTQYNQDWTGEAVEQILNKPEYSVNVESGEVYQLLKKHSRTTQQIIDLGKDAQEDFQKMISDLDPDVQKAYKALIRQPEVLDILVSNEDYTAQLGKVFKENPDWVLQKTDSLAIYYQNEHQEELDDYKKELEDNPEMKEETIKAAKEYAEENGEDPNELDQVIQESDGKSSASTQSSTTVNVTYNYAPYPYWYGYPYWYPAPVWRPYPWYFNCGFYIGGGGAMVVIGMPSFHYTHWYYRGPYYRYPSCTRYYSYHHHRYPYSRNGFNNSYRQNNITINNNNIVVGGNNNRKISTGNRYDFNSRPAQTKPNRPNRPSTRPIGNKANRPSTKPAQKPATRPAQKPASKPATQPAQAKKPSKTRDAPSRPSTQPAQRPAQNRPTPQRNPSQQYRANDYHNSNWGGRGAGAGGMRGGGMRAGGMRGGRR